MLNERAYAIIKAQQHNNAFWLYVFQWHYAINAQRSKSTMDIQVCKKTHHFPRFLGGESSSAGAAILGFPRRSTSVAVSLRKSDHRMKLVV
uniref:Uncharacterized protein n=1 Tax=Steinernema glaseri TaxID=37863 RepID=A0A1I7YRY0_9BILA